MDMDVVSYLKKFLAEQPKQEAAVPGLGVFYVGEKDGFSCILFKEVTPTDKTFLNYIAFEDNITEENARAETEMWVHRILHGLKSEGNVYIDGVGSFSVLADKVEFVPEVNPPKSVEAEFGLEEPSVDSKLSVKESVRPDPQVSADVSGQDSFARDANSAQVPSVPRQVQDVSRPNIPARQEKRPDRRPGQNERAAVRNTFRPNPNENRQRPAVSRPAAPNKGIVLENRRGNGNGGQANNRAVSRKSPQSGGRNIFTQWWFLLCCLAVVLLIVLFAIRPVRESLFGTGKTAEMEMFLPANDSLIEENVDLMLAGEADGMESLSEEKIVSENEQIAKEVISGQVQREKAEVKAKAVQSKTQSRPAARPASKPAAKPASQSVPKAFASEDPVKGKFYIIVGSFVNKTYAQNKFNELKKEGQNPSALYVAAKDIYYISVKTCATRAEAIDAKAYFRDQKRMECWIYEAK